MLNSANRIAVSLPGMDEEIKTLLERNLDLAEKTLKITKKLHRAHVWSRTLSFVKWSIIIFLLVFGFVKIQPYLNTLIQASQSIMQMMGEINNLIPKGLLR